VHAKIKVDVMVGERLMLYLTIWNGRRRGTSHTSGCVTA
jgi:hypothetical protein